MTGFARKYQVEPFDDDDPRDRRSEIARKAVIRAFISVQDETDVSSGEDFQDVSGGLLVGLVQVMMSHIADTDESHAAMRSGLIQLVPWAVDLTRDAHGLKPLSDGN